MDTSEKSLTPLSSFPPINCLSTQKRFHWSLLLSTLNSHSSLNFPWREWCPKLYRRPAWIGRDLLELKQKKKKYMDIRRKDRWLRESTGMPLAPVGRKSGQKSVRTQDLPVKDYKKATFKNTLTAKKWHCSTLEEVSHLKKRDVNKWRHLFPAPPLPLAVMMGPDTPRTLSWKVMAGVW